MRTLFLILIAAVSLAASANTGMNPEWRGGYAVEADLGNAKKPCVPKAAIVFTAPWCTFCDSELPKVEATLKGRLPLKVMVTTGYHPSKAVTQEELKQYKEYMRMDSPFLADEQWKLHKQYFGPSSYTIPKLVLVGDGGCLVQPFHAPSLDIQVRAYLN